MEISELQIGQGNINIEGVIISIGEVKNFNKFGKELRVADAVLEDDSGTINLNLWNDDIDRFKKGDKIIIENGYVNEFNGERQLTAGKFGKMSKVEETSEEEETTKTSEPTEEEQKAIEEADKPEEETTEENPKKKRGRPKKKEEEDY